MHKKYLEFLQHIFACTIIAIITGCSSTPKLGNNKPIELTLGKPSEKSITIRNLSNTDSVYLIPGGPYAENVFPLTSPISAMAVVKQKNNQDIVLAATNTPELLVIDLNNKPATLVNKIILPDTTVSLLVYNNILYAGHLQKGVSTYDISNFKDIKPTAYDETLGPTSKLRMFNNIVYALAKNKSIVSLQFANNNKTKLSSTDIHAFENNIKDFVISQDRLFIINNAGSLFAHSLKQPNNRYWQYSLQNPAQQLHYADGSLYVAGGKTGLTIFDVSSRDSLSWQGSHNKFDSINYVTTASNTAIIVDRNKRIATLNIKNKTLPITGSFYKPEQDITHLVAAQSTAYIATLGNIEKVSLPSHAHTQISNEGINQGGTRRAFIKDGIAYVADWFSGLHIYDVSNPKHPIHLSNFHTPGSSKGVVVEEGIAFVGDDDHGLQIIDVSDPANPKKISEILTTGLAYTLKKYHNTIYLADHHGGLHIIDVTDPRNPKLLGSHDTPGKSWAIEVKNNLAYVADDDSGLLILDIKNPKKIRQVGQYDPQGAAEDVFIKGNIAFVSFFDKGLYILDITKPRSLKKISSLPIPGNARSVTVVGNFAYLAGWESGLQIVDISDLQAPKIVSQYDTKGSAWGTDVYRQHAYVWDWWGGVKVIEVKNPYNPVLAGKYHARGIIEKLRNRKNYLYTANGVGGVQVFDIKNSLNPIWVTGLDVEGTVSDVWVSDHKPVVYIANGKGGLLLADISDPFYIRKISTVKLPKDINQQHSKLIRASNDTLAVADDIQGLLVFNATNTNNIKLTDQKTVKVNDLWFANNSTLFVAADTGFYKYTIDQQSKIAEQQFYSSKAPINKIHAQGDLIALAMDRIGISLWRRQYNRMLQFAFIPTTEKVLAINLVQDNLYVVEPHSGLTVYSIHSEEQPKIIARYPATDTLGQFIVKDNAAFFAGTDTISSISFLPTIDFQPVTQGVSTTFPVTLEVGGYHLELTSENGIRQSWPNAVTVSRPAPLKPKLTIEQFKQLLQKHREQQPKTGDK